MTSFRDIKRKMRRDVHDRMLVPALYYATPTATPRPVTVRLHTKFGAAIGTLPNNQGAQMVEYEPKILFLTAEVARPRVGAIVSVEVGEAYRVEATDPSDDITITAKVSRLPVEDPLLATLVVP